MKQIRLGDDKVNIAFVKRDGDDNISIAINDHSDSISLVISDDDLIIALRFLTEKEEEEIIETDTD